MWVNIGGRVSWEGMIIIKSKKAGIIKQIVHACMTIEGRRWRAVGHEEPRRTTTSPFTVPCAKTAQTGQSRRNC